MSAVVVAVDGPAGSGKSSVSRAAARSLGYAFLDTGAAYRALTWTALSRSVDPEDADAVRALIPAFAYRIVATPGGDRIAVGEDDVTDAIREPRITASVSAVARVPEVRVALNDVFRGVIRDVSAPGIVVEGRDITTVVAPEAPVRVLLVADPAARVARRHAELGEHVDADDVHDQVVRRDADDSTVAAFHDAAPGVTVLDSTFLTLEQVVDAICALVPAAYDPAVAR